MFETNNEENQERTQSGTPMEKVSPLKPSALERNSRLFSSPRYENLASYSGNKIFSSPRPLTKGTSTKERRKVLLFFEAQNTEENFQGCKMLKISRLLRYQKISGNLKVIY